jgi:hypothetical protein
MPEDEPLDLFDVVLVFARGEPLGNPRVAEAQSKGVVSIKAEADAFAANVRPIIMSLGPMSANAMARELNARRIATANGGRWSATTGVDAGLRRKTKTPKIRGLFDGRATSGAIAFDGHREPGEKRCTVLQKIAPFARRCKRF